MLQEMGQYANDIVNHLEANEREHNLLSVLRPLRRAGYNPQREISSKMIFDIIKRDFPYVHQTISQTLLELQNEESNIES